MKKIVIYADGTWNTPANIEGGKVAPTNVYEMFKSTAGSATVNGRQIQQLRYYTEGVGTSPGADKFIGGLFGRGINENIVEVYRFIVENYDPGDEIYLLGFSRGAYTVRSVAGLIRNSGILKKRYHQKIERAFEIYKGRGEDDLPSSPQAKFFRESFCHADKSMIKFLGVWDTVGSLGIPFRLLAMNGKYRFHDVELSSIIQNAYHAVSIDERRVFFRPSLWKQDPNHNNQVLEQVWFNGVHSDVGGGYPDGDLQILPLLYLQTRANECGLHFKSWPAQQRISAALNAHPHNAKDKLYYKLFPDYFRVINNEPKHKLNLTQRAGVKLLRLIMADTYQLRRKSKKDFSTFKTCEYLHESVVTRYSSNREKIPANLHFAFDSLVQKNPIIGLDGKKKSIQDATQAHP